MHVERKKLADEPRWVFIAGIIGTSLTSIALVEGGAWWLLFVTVPLLVFWIWGLVLKNQRANSARE
jgi:hypothetical protein